MKTVVTVNYAYENNMNQHNVKHLQSEKVAKQEDGGSAACADDIYE